MAVTVQQRLPSDNITTNNEPSVVTPSVTPPIRKSPIPKSKKRRISNKSKALEHETKGYLGARSRTTAYRTASYRPTLEKFSSVSFPNYVRRVVLGVPVEGVEPEDPYFSSCSTDDDEGGQYRGGSSNNTVVELTNRVSYTPTTQNKVVVTPDSIEAGDSDPCRNDDGDNYIAVNTTSPPETTKVVDLEYCEMVSPVSNDETLPEELNMDDNNADACSRDESSSSGGSENREPHITLPTTALREKVEKKDDGPKIATRSQTRSQTRSMTTPITTPNIYDRVYQSSMPSTPAQPPPPTRRKRKICPKRLKPDDLKLSDGIAKITPPEGWWDKAGIGKDTTGRGPTWQTGGSMGDMKIPGPIKQCASGIGGVYDFTMMEVPTMTVAQFRKKADAYRKRQIGLDIDHNVGNKAMDELARKFWRRLGPTMEAPIYGADMEGTLFDGAEACGWNIDRLESCLQLLRADSHGITNSNDHFRLPGVTSAYLYFGMWASVFAAHTEDMNLPSINYLHAGAPKYWYAISPDDSDRFESLMESQFSCAASQCPQFLRHKSHLLSPSIISKAGISYTTQVQRAGDVIITFPGSYHFGFNSGFNCAESTNFAFPEWIPMGEKAKVCMCHPHSVRIEMRRFKALHDKYEIETSYKDGPSMTYDEWAKLEVKRIRRTLTERKISHDNSKNKQQVVPKQDMKKGSRSQGKVVEVVKMLRHRNAMELELPTKKAIKKISEKNDWRLAVNARKSAFCPRTKVLCLVKSNDFDDVYFSGVISSVVEEHARVHFAGSSKNEDIWIQTDSCKLYLDGGSLESTREKSKKKRETNKKSKNKDTRVSLG